ncbi:DUF1922 domain-containing protein [Candidatus Bathyarchaeota archaeon]|nr:DUF1922 domain-containing protein [Candidatus Bathyarchaeota archaeon]
MESGKDFRRVPHVTSVLVVVCSKCSGLLLAKADQKSRTCPYCGCQITLAKVKKVASAENSYKASEILRKLKSSVAREQRRI